MEQAEPSRDAAHNQRVQAMYEEAMAEVKAAHAAKDAVQDNVSADSKTAG